MKMIINKKTQKVQYNEDDNHPVQSRIFGYGGVVLGGDSANRVIK